MEPTNLPENVPFWFAGKQYISRDNKLYIIEPGQDIRPDSGSFNCSRIDDHQITLDDWKKDDLGYYSNIVPHMIVPRMQ